MTTDDPARLTRRQFPAYRHRPGRTPHPTRSPAGHSYLPPGTPETARDDLNTVPWLTCEDFLFGIDLFNADYWWESHEYMEGLWHASGHGTPAGHVLQAVIQCAAAHLRKTAGPGKGARRLLAQAEVHVSLAGPVNLGLDLIGMLAETGAFVTGDTDQHARLVLLDQ